ncbi:MAG: transcription factor WhiB [Pseudonocardiales bacterium]|nr:transcription factor WhiB [Pseudonocardiales bacterium]
MPGPRPALFAHAVLRGSSFIENIVRVTVMIGTHDIPAAIDADRHWRERSACRDMNNDAFYVAEHERGSSKQMRITAAKSVCETCPVQRPCLQWALDVAENHGVWGGMTPEERKLIRAHLRPIPGKGRRTA